MSYPMTQQYNLKTYTKSKNTNEKLFRSHINRKDIAFAGLKKEFDKELTIQLCPPMDFYIGCKFKKRIIVAIEDILIKDTETGKWLQSREDVNVTDNVSEIKTSFRYRGWLHDQQPLFVQQVKGKPKLFILRSGFNRIKAATELGWKYIIVDVYDDAEKLEDQVLFKYVVNNDNLPSAQNKNIDFVKGAVEAIDKNVVNQKKDSAIVDFLKKITCTSDGIALRTPDEIESYEKDKIEDDGTVIKGALKKSCLLYKVRRQRGKEAHIKPLDGSGANLVLKELGRGYAGATLITSQQGAEIGYAFEEKNSLHRIFWDGIKLYARYQKPIMCFGYIENPSSVTLSADRISCKEHFDTFLEEAKKKIYETIKFDSLVYAMSGKSIDTINDVPWNIEEIFKWGGFIPQDESVVDGVKAEDDIIQ